MAQQLPFNFAVENNIGRSVNCWLYFLEAWQLVLNHMCFPPSRSSVVWDFRTRQQDERVPSQACVIAQSSTPAFRTLENAGVGPNSIVSYLKCYGAVHGSTVPIVGLVQQKNQLRSTQDGLTHFRPLSPPKKRGELLACGGNTMRGKDDRLFTPFLSAEAPVKLAH